MNCNNVQIFCSLIISHVCYVFGVCYVVLGHEFQTFYTFARTLQCQIFVCAVEDSVYKIQESGSW
jgi:hypothetical protein